MKKKILIVSRSFYPVNSPRSFRTTELAKEFASQGHEVTVYIHKNQKEHLEFEKKFNINIKDLGGKKYHIFDISKGNSITILLKRLVNRLLLQLIEFPDIELMFKVKKVLKNESDYDLLISIAVPHTVHWGVAWARSKKNQIALTWVADCGDPYMGNNLDTFRKMFYFKYVEKWWCKKADVIAVPFEGAKAAYYPAFHRKIKVIPQGFKFEESEIDPLRFKPNPLPTFAFSGSFIRGARDPRNFIRFLLNKDLNFKFIIYTKKTDLIADLIQESQGKIEVKSYIPRLDLIEQLSTMDFIVNINNSNATQLPSKLIDYYLAQRPILSIDSFDFDQEKVTQFLEGDYRSALTIDAPEQYRIENVVNRFIDAAADE